MSRRKKKKKPQDNVIPGGVWIAPDLERTIKGEGGRRGLTEPPYSYYLHLADVALRSSGSPSRSTMESTGSDSIPSPQLSAAFPPKPPKLKLPKPPKSPKIPKPAKRPRVKPPQKPDVKKLTLPKPPKRKR